jgi:hypothetical protein
MLDCENLNNDPKYEMLKNCIRSYYTSNDCYETGSMKSILYRSLIGMMRTLANTKDVNLQRRNL